MADELEYWIWDIVTIYMVHAKLKSFFLKKRLALYQSFTCRLVVPHPSTVTVPPVIAAPAKK